ncbi:MAG: SufD family Fe-S cluster assembly protein, partial [Roseibium sp.]
MSEVATLPTRRDEAWRYADIDAVAKLGAAGIADWQDITIAAGETKRICLIVGGDALEVTRIRLKVGDGATGEVFATSAGDDYTRLEIEVTLGKGSHFEFGGVTIGGGDAVREFVTQTVHAQPNATSNQTVRSVHWGAAAGNFLGEIKVARDAQKTDAAQDFKGLLLEAGASANAVPQLEIFADDVKCAHGATVGQLDEAARFYMAARGLSPQAAQRLLVQAFIGDAFVELEDEEEREKLLEKALAALE